MKPLQSKVIIVSAPSGAGKTTIVKHLLSNFPELGFSVSATSRPMRPGEKDDREYHFMTVENFREMIAANLLLEWQEVYPGSYYGTPIAEVERMHAAGQVPVFDVDVVGGLNIKKIYGNKALALFVKPPSIEVLEKRLRARATDSEESLQKRLSKVRWEMDFESRFDKVIVNDKLQSAFQEAEIAVNAFLKPVK